MDLNKLIELKADVFRARTGMVEHEQSMVREAYRSLFMRKLVDLIASQISYTEVEEYVDDIKWKVMQEKQ